MDAGLIGQPIMGDTDLVPYNAGTFGSRSMPDMLPQLRKVAATARRVLDEQRGEMDKVRTSRDCSYRRISGDGFSGLEGVGPPDSKVDGRSFVTGEHRYSADRILPGMLHAVVVRPPVAGASWYRLIPPRGRTLPWSETAICWRLGAEDHERA